MDYKTCAKCKKELPIDEFYKIWYRPPRNRSIIKIRHYSYCKECARDYRNNRPPKKQHTWTDEEKEYIRQNYRVTDTKELAMRMGYSVQLVRTVANQMGCYKK